MAYYSGYASSYPELLNQVVNACVDNGWNWSDSILSKNNAFVKVETLLSSTSNSNGPGLRFQGGTGKSGSSLINPSSAIMRMGPFGAGATIVPTPTFPIFYHIFIFDNPDEVFIIIKYDIDRFQFAAFGMSSIADCGLWVSASLGLRYMTGSGTTGTGIQITAISGGASASSSYVSSSGFMWHTLISTVEVITQTIYIETDGIGWSHLISETPAQQTMRPLIERLPAAWSSESVLLPIQPTLIRASNKTSLIADIENARYLRIDNHEPEQILTLGTDKWMVFPFHRKNVVVRNGGTQIDHTGTFGWAIRYDGP
ncbi:MAG: hypothetical protein KAZ18_00345 [Acinetobacter sp.]|nr:hypothetical protein [Acinetobacter sp.]